MKPYWENPKGFHAEILIGQYSSWVPLFRRQLYDVVLDPLAPMTLVDSRGRRIQPDKHVAECDFASVPRLLWGIPGLNALSYPGAAYIHDSAFRYHGLYFSIDGIFQFRPVTFDEANQLLAEGVLASGGYIMDGLYKWGVDGMIGKHNWVKQYDPKLMERYGFA